MSAVTYAEDTLGVHEPWAKAQEALAFLEESTEQLTATSKALREAKADLKRGEDTIMVEVWGTMPDASVAEKERQINLRCIQSVTLAELQDKIAWHEGEVDALHNRIKELTNRIRAHSARMNELGGLLFFYGVAKQEALRG